MLDARFLAAKLSSSVVVVSTLILSTENRESLGDEFVKDVSLSTFIR